MAAKKSRYSNTATRFQKTVNEIHSVYAGFRRFFLADTGTIVRTPTRAHAIAPVFDPAATYPHHHPAHGRVAEKPPASHPYRHRPESSRCIAIYIAVLSTDGSCLWRYRWLAGEIGWVIFCRLWLISRVDNIDTSYQPARCVFATLDYPLLNVHRKPRGRRARRRLLRCKAARSSRPQTSTKV